MLHDVIENIKIKSDYYQKRDLTISLIKGSKIHTLLTDNQTAEGKWWLVTPGINNLTLEDGSTELIRWLIVGFGWWNEIEVDGNSGHCRTNKKGRKEKRIRFQPIK